MMSLKWKLPEDVSAQLRAVCPILIAEGCSTASNPRLILLYAYVNRERNCFVGELELTAGERAS